MYLHELENGKPKPALPEDVAKLEARAKSNPSLRPPSKPPPKSPSTATGIPIVKMLMVPVGPVSSFDFAIYYDCEDEPDIDLFYDCREPPELRHAISDTGDICPTTRTEPCRHMRRTFKTTRTPVTQSNRYAEWVRCHGCGHTHAKMTYSAICCMQCKARFNMIIEEYRRQQRVHWTVRLRHPPIDVVDVTRTCPWTKWGLLLARFHLR